MESCQVTVTEGTLQGRQCTTYFGKKYYSFEGIPYAKPPVGKLRFANPLPPATWIGVRDATKPGNKCIQSNPYSATPIDGSEDCLYLNVYTPVLPCEKIQNLSVFFFVHGGRLIFGHGNYYTPDYLIKHDVILVTLNYRLHILGWLCLNIPECPGNAGLKDAVAALRWVNKNIGYFNGDSANVTVFGESAGSAIATSFLLSEMTRGLFSKVISQSGNCVADLFYHPYDPIEKARKISSIMGKKLTDAREIFEYLIDADVEDLIIAYTTAELSRPQSVLNSYLLPVIEQKFDGVERYLSENPRVSMRENRFYKVPVMSCRNSHESAIFFRDEAGNVRYETDLHFFIPQFCTLDRNHPKAKKMQQKIRHFYLKNKELNDSAKLDYLDMASDALFSRDIMFFSEILSKYSDKTYVLKFNYSGDMHTRVMKSLGLKGATHGDMIQYQFYRKSKANNCTERDGRIVAFLSEAFCNFAKTGVPTWSNQKTKWLPYTHTDKRTLVVDDEITCEKDVDKDRLEFWTELLKEQCKL